MSIIPGLCRYYIQRKWLMNIRGHRQFLMTPTAFPQYPKLMPKVPPKIPHKNYVLSYCSPPATLSSSSSGLQVPFSSPTNQLFSSPPFHPGPSLLFGSSILPFPTAPLFSVSATVDLPYGTPSSSPLLPYPPAPLPSSSPPLQLPPIQLTYPTASQAPLSSPLAPTPLAPTAPKRTRKPRLIFPGDKYENFR